MIQKQDLTVLLILLALCSPACRQKPVSTLSEDFTRVKTIPVEHKVMSLPVHAAGYITTASEVRLSFKTGGLIEFIGAEDGRQVEEGYLLARINTDEIDAGLDIASRAYDKALRDFDRVRNLYSDSAATLEQLQNAETAFKVAGANLSIARFNKGHSSIVAPADGLILRKLASESELIAPGQPVFLFGASDRIWKVKAGFSDKEVVKIAVGDTALIRVDAHPGIIFRGSVDKIAGMSDPGTGTYEVEVTFGCGVHRMAAGFIAGIDIYPSSGQEVVMVPLRAVTGASGTSAFVFTVDGESRAKKLPVFIKGISGENAILTGIPDDTRLLITEGAAYLKDGSKIKVVI